MRPKHQQKQHYHRLLLQLFEQALLLLLLAQPNAKAKQLFAFVPFNPTSSSSWLFVWHYQCREI